VDKLKEITVTDIFDAFTVHSEKGKSNMTVNRSSYGLTLCYKGQITYSHKGKKVLSDSDHIVFLPKGETYLVLREKTGDFPVINFDSRNFLCTTPISVPVFDNESLLKDFEQIKALLSFKDNKAKIMSIFYDMLHKISISGKAEFNILLPAVRYIEQNISDPQLNNSLLAHKCNISEVYFRRLFIKKYGITPKQYIINARLSKAKQLLADGVLKVNVISEQCGFTNPYHFCRLFKERTGLTPTGFMKKNERKSI